MVTIHGDRDQNPERGKQDDDAAEPSEKEREAEDPPQPKSKSRLRRLNKASERVVPGGDEPDST